MPRSPFALAFDHIDSCSTCDYARRRLCPDGRVLLDAAYAACKLIVGMPEQEPRAKA